MKIWNVVFLLLLCVQAYAQNIGGGASSINASNPTCCVRPQDYGPITNNPSNDTQYIDQAFQAALVGKKCVYFPGSSQYAYNGNGWTANADGDYACVIGDGFPLGQITLSAGKYLVDNNGAHLWGGLYFSGIYTSSGAGAIRDRYSSVDTNARKLVLGNYFTGYTVAAVSTSSSDSPLWHFSNNFYIGANSTTTMGIALCGLGGGVLIENEFFQENKVHIKLTNGGNNTTIGGSTTFIQLASGSSRVAVWIAPTAASAVNAGEGFVLRDTKFGNENLDSSDYAVLYADEGAGTYCGDKLFSVSASTGYIAGHTIDSVYIGGSTGSPTRSLVYSTTPNVSSSIYKNTIVAGTSIKRVLEFASPGSDTGNIIGPVLFPNGSTGYLGGTNGAGAVATTCASVSAATLTTAYGYVTHC